MLESLTKTGRLFQIKTAFVSVSNLKIIFMSFSFIFILYVWTGWPFRVVNSNYSCPHCPAFKSANIQPIVTDSVTIKEVVKYRNINLRLVGAAESIEQMDFLLNIRKLIVFAVHELNQPLKYTNCTKWWANPLDMISHEEKPVSKNFTDHLIEFFVQPGNLKCQVFIRQQLPPINVDDQELKIVSSFEMDKQFQAKPCDGEPVISDDAKRTCLCSSDPKLEEGNKITAALRNGWNYTDRELVTWNPDKSFYIPDYMNFTDYEWFIHSPGNSTLEVNQLGYSTEYCGPDVRMLVMVSSAPKHFKNRKIIRETYASPSNLEGKGIKVVFLMGIPADAAINQELKLESEIFQDIIQANYDDSYHNLTISHLSMYKWAHLTCIGGKDKGVATVPPFILKADDDFLLNVDLALEVALQNTQYEFIGCLFCGTKALRNVALMRKYYTPRYMHISNTYAGYLSGVTYLMRTDIIPRLLHMSKTTPLIHMDDAYVTGILPRQLKIYPRGSPLFTYRRKADACLSKKTISSFVLNPDDMAVQWLKFKEPMTENCTLKDLETKVTDLDSWTASVCLFNKL